jgi:putative ABC transport system permease protein
MTRVLLRLYRAALAAYPPSLRRAHGSEMLQCARAAVDGRGAAALLRLFVDLVVSVPREWLALLKGVSMNGLVRDIRYAVRLLWRSPGFSVAAIATLALGIGANTAIFSLADATLLHPIAVAQPQELYSVTSASSYPDYQASPQQSDVFNGMAASTSARVNAAAGGRADLVMASFVSGNYFGVLGVPPVVGRTIAPSDDERNGPVVAVLSYRWWHTRFGGDAGIVGKTIRVNNVAVTIIGVAHEGFSGISFYEPAQLFLPVRQTPGILTGFFARPGLLTSRGIVWLVVVARLKPGVAPAAAAAALDATYRQAHPPRPGSKPDTLTLTPLHTRALGGSNERSVSRFVGLLATVVGLTLLIGCANLANLLLSRGAARRREIALRMAVGAGAARVARQLLIESLVLSTVGGAIGLYIAAVGIGLLARFQLPGGIDIEGLGLGLNRTALLFTALVAGTTGVLFGVAPAWRAARTDVLESLREESRATSARSALRASLVAAQVAFSLVLLTGTGLFLRSLVDTLRVPLGFDPAGVATASVNLGAARYDHPRASAFYDAALTRVHRLPGVTAAAWTNLVPTRGSRVFTATVDGYRPHPDEQVLFYYSSVGPEYFQAAGTRLVRGRVFTREDSSTPVRVAIINEAAAGKYWAGRDPLQGRLSDDDKEWVQVIGVVENAKVRDLDEVTPPYVYFPFERLADGAPTDAAHILVRTGSREAESILSAVGAELRAIDRDAPVYDVTPFDWRVRQLVMPQRIGAVLFGVFSALALLLAAVGIYGVASYVTAMRTRELGIRIALGADRRRLIALVLRQGLVPVAAGLAAGLAIAAIASRFAAAFLHGVTPYDPLTYTAVVVVLGSIAVCATWLPARRAASVEPMRALRDH